MSGAAAKRMTAAVITAKLDRVEEGTRVRMEKVSD